MLLKGSCHCGMVGFQVNSPHPYPFNLCYCGICRKTAGGGGYAINIMAEADSLRITGEEFIRVYQARIDPAAGESGLSPGKRSFCGECGSALWMWDGRWPALLHPFASAVDSPLPPAPERTHLMLAFKPAWVPLQADPADRRHDGYPTESIAQWHERQGLVRQE